MKCRWLLILACLFGVTPAAALDQVTLQLKWRHCFQFAGYYAAQELGYYREAGLEVRLEEGAPGVDVVGKVLSDQAQFGVGTSGLLLERHAGKPVVVLAVIFQHSPQVLIAREQYPTQSIHDLVGKRVMIELQAEEILAYLKREGIPLNRITQVEHSFNIQDLIDQKVDALTAYVTNEPYDLNKTNIPYQIYTPRSAGIDFYADNLFTSEQELKDHSERVKAFRAASLRGWQYAMAHPETVIDWILARYNTQHLSRDHLRFEAGKMAALIRSDLVEVGYMSPGRWRHIADTYADIGMLPMDFPLEGFLYEANPKIDFYRLYAYLAAGLALIGIISGIAFHIHRINRRLIHSIAESEQAQNALRTLSTAIEQSPTSVVITDLNAAIQYVNPQFTQVTGYSAEEAIGQNPRVLNSGLTRQTTFQDMWRHLAEGRPWSGELINRRKNGQIYWEEAHISPVRDTAGQLVQYVAVKLDITERKRAEQDEKSRNRVLELLARGAALEVILKAIVLGVEESHPTMLCSILLLDLEGRRLHTGAAPSLPDFFNAVIDGLEIGPGAGSCGTAAFTGERVIVADIQTHPYWENFKHLAARASLSSCWSEPIRSASGKTLGTFAIYHHESHRPADADIRLIEQSANLAAIAIDRSSAIEALRISEEQYRLLAENATDVIWTMDIEGRFTYISPSVEKLRGYTAAEAMRQSLDASLTPESRVILAAEIARAVAMLRAGQPFPNHRGEFEQPCKDGSTVWAEITTTGIYNASGNFVGILGVSRDITERKQIQDRIAHMAHHDALTNLPNRALFSDRLEQALALAGRNQTRLAVMFIDLDKFKPINDTYGHAVGDLLLREVAARLRACVRASDTVGRIGGDEFVVLLFQIRCPKDALQVAENIRLALKQPFALAGRHLNIGASIGVAIAPEHGLDQTELCKNADIAMYRAKENGRDKVKLFQPGMRGAGD